MTEKAEVEIFLIIDENGNYAAGIDQDTAEEAAVDDGFSAVRHVIRLTLQVPMPKVIDLAADLPEGKSEFTVTVA